MKAWEISKKIIRYQEIIDRCNDVIAQCHKAIKELSWSCVTNNEGNEIPHQDWDDEEQ
jgi:hypothetical protein